MSLNFANILLSIPTKLGTEDAVFKTGAEIPLPIELEEGVLVQ